MLNHTYTFSVPIVPTTAQMITQIDGVGKDQGASNTGGSYLAVRANADRARPRRVVRESAPPLAFISAMIAPYCDGLVALAQWGDTRVSWCHNTPPRIVLAWRFGWQGADETHMATESQFFAAARTMVGPPMSIISMQPSNGFPSATACTLPDR